MSGYREQHEGESRPLMWERLQPDGSRTLMAPLGLFNIWLRGAVKRPGSEDHKLVEMLCTEELEVVLYQTAQPKEEVLCMLKALMHAYTRTSQRKEDFFKLTRILETREGQSVHGTPTTDPLYDARMGGAWLDEARFPEPVCEALRFVQGLDPLPVGDGR